MKKLLRIFLINLFALWSSSYLIAGFEIKNGVESFLKAAFFFSLINIFLKPLLKLLLLPINLLTLGLFSWILNVMLIYILTLIVPQVQVHPFDFPGFAYQGFVIPPIHFDLFWTFVVSSFIISLVSSFLHWLTLK